MSQYTLQSLNTKTKAVAKKALLASGKSSVKAQFGLQYQVVDAETGRAPRKQVLKKMGKDLIIEIDGEQVAVIRGFYEDSTNKEAPTYRVDEFCAEDGKSIEDSKSEDRYSTVVGGTADSSAHASGDGVVYHEDASLCLVPYVDPNTAGLAAGEGLSTAQMVGLGLGALLVGGGATAIGVSSGNSGGGSSSTPAPAAPQLTNADDNVAGGIVGSLSSGDLTNDNRPTLTFSAQAGSTVKVYDGATLLGTAVEGPAGTFTFTPTSALADGSHSFTATATSAGGTSSPTVPFTLNIDATGPAAPLADVAALSDTGASNTDNLTNDTTPIISGNGTAGDTITVTFPTGEVLTAVVAANGTWSVTPIQGLADGLHNVLVTATDPAGNTSPATTVPVTIDATGPAAPLAVVAASSDTGASNTDNLTNDTTPTIAGAGTPGDTITVTFPTGEVLTTVVAANGSWNVTPTQALADGLHNVLVTATDPAGNTSPATTVPVTIDTAGGASLSGLNIPDAPHGVNNTEAANGVELVITLPPDASVGDVVTSVITDPNGRVITLTHTILASDLPPAQGGTASGSGPFTITQTVPLADLKPGTAYLDGRWETSTTVGDLAGNVGPAQTGSFNLAANAPSITLNTIAGDDRINAVEKQGAVAVTGSTSAEPGQTVTITVTGPNGTNLTYYAAVLPNGTFSTDIPANIMAGLANGSYTLAANVSNVAGTPAVAASKTLAIDIVAPTVTISSVAGDAGANGIFNGAERGFNTSNYSLSPTVATPPVIAGTTDAEPGQIVTVLLNGNSYTAIVQSNGSWTVTLPQADAAALVHGTNYPISVSVSDAAGNPSTSASGSLTANIAPADVPTVVPNFSRTTTPTITGTAKDTTGAALVAGDTIAITINRVTVTATIQSSGTATNIAGVTYDPATKTWSIDTSVAASFGLADGTYNVAVAVTHNGSTRSDISVGELVINTVPPSITLSSISGGTINAAEHNQSTTISGTTTAEPGSTVTLAGLGGVTYTAIVQAGTGGVNTFSIPVSGADIAAIADGSLTLNASVTNRFGLSGNDTEAVLVDTTAPSAPAVALTESPLGVSAAEAASSGGTPIVLTLPLDAQVGDIVNTVVTKPDGSVYLIPSHPLTQADITAGSITQTIPTAQLNVDGTWTTSTTITDPAGNTSQPGTGTFVLDTQGPGQPAVALPEAANGVNAAEAASLGGTPLVVALPTNAAVGDTVTSIITKPDGSTLTLTSVLTAADIIAGSVSQLIPTSALTIDGTWTTSTTIADIAGNTSPARAGGFTLDTTPPAAPAADVAATSDTGVSNTDNNTSYTTPTISGTGIPGDTITVTMPPSAAFPNGEVLTAVVDGSGNWHVEPTGALADGLHNVLVTATDPAGNTSPATTVPVRIDTTAPATPAAPDLVASSDTGTSSTDNSTADNTPTFSGTGTPGDVITVYDGNTVLGTAVVDGNSNWTLTAPANMADGVHQISTTESDPAGNTSARSPSLAVTIDTQGPSVPSGALTQTAQNDTGTVGDNLTRINAPVISGQVDSGAAVSVVINGKTYTIDPTAATQPAGITYSAGAWSIDLALAVPVGATAPAVALADGSYTPVITATDSAGNSTTANGVAFVVDTTPPAAPAASLATSSNSGLTTDNITNVVRPEISGTGTNGDVITLYAPDGITVLGTAIVTGGTWSIMPNRDLSTGLNNLSVKATDPAGNTSAATPVPVVYDTTVAAPVINATNGAVINGTGEPGATVTLSDGTNTWTTTVAADGTWSVTPGTGNVPVNGANLTATQTDVAGNPSGQGTQTVDSNMPQVNPSNGQVITGTGAPGQQLALTFNGSPIRDSSNNPITVTVQADGTWSTLGTAIGTTLVTGNQVVATDTSNSSKTASGPVDTTPPATGTGGLAHTAASDTGSASTDNLTSNPLPQLSGSGAEAGATVAVTVDGHTYTTTADANGNWSVPVTNPLLGADPTTGQPITYSVSITVTDKVGNSATVAGTSFTVDTSAPTVPTIDSASDNVAGGVYNGNVTSNGATNDNTPTLTFTADPGSIVNVYDNGVLIGTATESSSSPGTFTFTPAALSDGQHSFTVTASDAAGNTSPTSPPYTLNVDTIAPLAPTGSLATSSNSGLTTDNITNDNTPTIIGSGATPGDTITLYAPDGTTVLGTAVVNAQGNWSIDASNPTAYPNGLPDGLNDLKIAATDPAGNTSPQATVPVVIDTAAPGAPAADVARISDTGADEVANITSDTTPTITGTGATPGDTITLKDANGNTLGTAVVAADRTWSITSTTALPTGTQNLSVTATDPQGNTGPATSVPVTIDTSIANPTGGLASASDTGVVGDNKTNDPTPELSGSAEPGATVEVTVNGVTYTTTANSSGNWSINLQTDTPVGGSAPAAPLADGTYTPVIKVTDGAGNTVTTNGTPFTVDQTVAAPVIAPTNGQLITGTGEPGATVTLTMPNPVSGQPSIVIGTAVVAADGSWSITPASPITNGTNLTATQTDTAGNTSGPDTEPVNTALPVAPVITLANASTVTGTGQPGATIALTLADGTPLRDANGAPITVTVAFNGTWTSPLGSALPDGAIVKATQTIGSNTAYDTGIVDAMPPAAPAAVLDPAPTNDTGAIGDGLTKNNTPTISGSGGTPGDAITVTLPTGEVLHTTVSANGTWSVTPTQPLADGLNNVLVTATDPSGNTSPATTVPVTIDTAAPANGTGGLSQTSDTLNGTARDNLTSDNTPILSGTAEPGSTVVVVINGNTYRTVATGGAWSIDLETAIPDGATAPAAPLGNTSYTPRITVIDAAGNSSTTNGTAFTVDATAPNTPSLTSVVDDNPGITGALSNGALTNDATPTLTFTAEARSTVKVYDGSNLLGTAVEGPAGTLTFTPTRPLSDGAHSFTATATDAAGNVSGPTTAFNLTLDTTVPAAPSTLSVPENSNGSVNAAEVVSDGVVPVTVPLTTTGANAVHADDVITLTVDDRTTNTPITITYTVTASDITNGSANVLVPTANIPVDGAYDVSAVITDPAGNTSSASTGSFVVDKTAPAAGTGALSSTSDNNGDGVSNAADSDNLTKDNTPILSGTAEAGSTVEVTVNGNTYLVTLTGTTWTLDLQTAIPVGGTTPATGLPDGSYTPSITVTDAAGNSTTSSGTAFTVDASAPAVVGDLDTASDSSGTLANVAVGNSTDNITNDTTPTFTGTTTPYTSITLVIAAQGSNQQRTYTTTSDNLGNWSVTVPNNEALVPTPASGPNIDPLTTNNATTFNVTVTATDTAGNSASVSIPVTIDTIVTDPIIRITNGISPVTGTGEAGASVVLYQSVVVATNDLNSATAGDTLTITGPVNGVYTFSYAVTTGHELAAGHVFTTSKPRDIVITSQPGAGATGTVTGTISATAYAALVTAGSTVTLYDSVKTGDVVTVDANGNWSVTFGSPLANGTILTANSVDLAGNIDPPGVAIVQTDNSIPLINPTDGSPITGTGKPGDTITVTYSIPGPNNTTISVTLGPITVADGTDPNVPAGTWSVTPPAGQVPPNGTLLTATDNQTNGSSNGRVDSVAPNPPAIDLVAASDTGTSSTDNLTNDTTPTLSGTGEPGSTITILVNGQPLRDSNNNPVTAVVAADGTWSVTLPTQSAGLLNLTATATDAAGNTSDPSSLLPVTIDTAAPTATPPTPDMTAATDTGASNTDNVTANPKPSFTIGALPNDVSSVVLYVTPTGSSTPVAVAATYDPATGTITPNAALPEGTFNVSIAYVDAAGNVGAPSTTPLPIRIDTTPPGSLQTAPAAPDMTAATDSGADSTPNNADNQDNLTSDSTPDFNIGALPAAVNTVLLLVDGVVVSATIATDSSGNKILTPTTPLSDGPHDISYQYVDLAGNTSLVSAVLPVVIDTAAPVTPAAPDLVSDTGRSTTDNVTNDNTPTFTVPTGQGDVILLVDGVAVPATYDPITGALTPTGTILDGTHSIAIKIVDAAVNVSTASPSLPVTIDTTAPAVPTVNVLDTMDTTPVLTGTASLAAGEVLTVTVGGVVYTIDPAAAARQPAGITYNSSTGAWSVDTGVAVPTSGTVNGALMTPLADAAYNLIATVTDTAGNASVDASVNELRVNSNPLTITLTGGATIITNDATPVITGSIAGISNLANTPVTIIVGGATYRVMPNAQGVFTIDTGTALPVSGTFTPVANGNLPVTASTTSPTGAICSAAQTFAIDTTAPVITITKIAGDTVGVSGNGTFDINERGFNTTNYTLNGSVTSLPEIMGATDAEDGQTVTVTLNCKTYTANVFSGAWSVTLSDDDAKLLNHGSTYSISASVNDKAGNSGSDTNNGLTVNIAPPDVPTVVSQTNTSVTPTVTGTAMKLDPAHTAQNPLPGIALASGDSFTVTLKSANGATTLGTYRYTLGASSPVDQYDASTSSWSTSTVALTYNTTTGAWSLAVPSAAGLALPTGTTVAGNTVAGNTYNVDVSTTTTAGLTRTDISSGELLVVKPVTITSIPEGASNNLLNNVEAANGTLVNLSLVGTGALAGQVLKIMWDGQPVLITLTADDIAAGTVAALIPKSVLQTATPAGTSETLQVSVSLLETATSSSAISTSANSAVNVNFIAPTAPTINNTLWASSGAGAISDLSGIGEAKYAIDATTHVTTGTADNALYVSEAYANGTVVRVQLPQAGTGIITPVAGDSLVLTWGTQTYTVPTTISAPNITAKYVDVTIPYSVISTQPFGTVNVTAQIQSATSGNISNASPVATVNWLYDMPAGLLGGDFGFAINGELASNKSGYSVANAGDVNGDGLDDIIIGAPSATPNGLTGAGRAYVVFGNSTNTYSNFDLSQLNVSGNTLGFIINGAVANAGYGAAVSGAGDINGDGLADLIVGDTTAYTSSNVIRPLELTTTAGGPTYVVFGRLATAQVNLSALSATSNTDGFMVSSPFANGWSVTNAGDVNGDGLDDLALTAPAYNGRAGVAYVVYGKGTGTPVITGSSNFTTSSEGFVINGGSVGGTVAAVTGVSSGDVNGDGLSDLIVGSWNSDAQKGDVFVIYGSSNSYARSAVQLSSLSDPANGQGFKIVGNSWTGVSVAGVADMNGDGLDDVLLQSTAAIMTGATNPGVAWVAFGKSNGTTINISDLERGTGGFAINAGVTTGAYGAYTVANAGDINGDGLGDIIVTNAAGNLTAGAGAAYVVFGKTSLTNVNVTNMATSDGFRILGQCANDRLGVSAAGAGDINGDGFDDIIVGAYTGDPGNPARTDAGKTYVIYGGASAYTPTIFQVSNGDVIGTSSNDTITGTTGNNQLVGGVGNDILIANGGADVIYGGAGIDRIVINADNITKLKLVGDSQSIIQIDGGTGIDTLAIDGTGVTLALAAKAAILQTPDPAIINVGLPNVTGSNIPPSAMAPIRGAYWGTTNPSGLLEIYTFGAYGVNMNNTFTLAQYGGSSNFVNFGVSSSPYYNVKAMQLINQTVDDNNIFVNVSKRAGEKVQITFLGTPYFPEALAKDQINVYWGNELLTVIDPVYGQINLYTIDIPISSIDEIKELKFVADEYSATWPTAPSGSLMGDFKVLSNLVEIPPITLTDGGALTLKNLPLNVTLSDGVNSQYIGRAQLVDANGNALYWTDSNHTATTTTSGAGTSAIYANANKQGQTLYVDANGNQYTSATLVTVQKTNGGGAVWLNAQNQEVNSATTTTTTNNTAAVDSNNTPLLDTDGVTQLYWTDSSHTTTTTSPTTSTTVNNTPVMVPSITNGHLNYVTAGNVAVTPVDFSTTVDVSQWNTRNLYLLANTTADTPTLVAGSTAIVYDVTQKGADGSSTTTSTNYTLGSTSVPALPDPGTPLDRIHNIERIDLGDHANSISLGLADVLNMTNDNQFNTTNGWTAVTGKVPPGWDNTQHGKQMVIDGGNTIYSVTVQQPNGTTTTENRSDTATLEGQWAITGQVQHTENGVTTFYKVIQSLVSNAQVLVGLDVKLNLKPSILANFGEMSGAITQGEAISSATLGGTTAAGVIVRVYINDTTATTNDKMQLSFGNSQILSSTLTQTDLDNGYVDIMVQRAAIDANVPPGNYGYVPMAAALVNANNKVISRGEVYEQLVDFSAVDRPTINSAAWTTSASSNLSGIPEAKYELLYNKPTTVTSATTVPTSGTSDGVITTSEAYQGNGTVVRIGLPNTAAGSTMPAAVGDKVVLDLGVGGIYGEVTYILTAPDITNKFVLLDVPFSMLSAIPVGVDVPYVATIVSGSTGNISAPGVVNVQMRYEVPLSWIGLGSTGVAPPGFVFSGQSANDLFGSSVASAGDVNGDGLEDFVVGAYQASPQGTNSGKAYVIYGRTDAGPLNLSAIAAGSGGFVINGNSASAYVGRSVSGIGDVNGDGLADIIVGAPSNQLGTYGAAYVIYGSSTQSSPINLSNLATSQGFKISGDATAGYVGNIVAAAGDFNADGIDDFMTSGYIIFGKNSGGNISASNVSAGTNGFKIAGISSSGISPTSFGDFNGDGIDDVVMGMPTSGKTYVIFGKTDTNAITLDASKNFTNASMGLVINGAAATNGDGHRTTMLGDVNGDGLADVGIESASGGYQYVVFGTTSNTAISLSGLSSSSPAGGFAITGFSGNFNAIAPAGDLNGDGLMDVLVMNYSDTVYGSAYGSGYVVFGKTGTSIVNVDTMAGSDGFRIVGWSGALTLGAVADRSTISSAGDINGDGFDDLVIGAQNSTVNGNQYAGQTYVVYGGASEYTSLIFNTADGDAIGTAGDDTLRDSIANRNNQFVGGAGDDVITGNGGADVMYGGAGNDTFVLNADNVAKLARNSGNDSQNIARIDGGTGFDTIQLDGSGITLDLTAIRSDVIRGVENINLTGSGNNTVKLTLTDVLDMGSSNLFDVNNAAIDTRKQLMVTGDAGDVVQLTDIANWTLQGGGTPTTYAQNGHNYVVYNHNTANVQLLVDEAIYNANNHANVHA